IGAAPGSNPATSRGVDDLTKLPSFSKTDLMRSVAARPPYGDFHGMDADGQRNVVMHTTSGTTGTLTGAMLLPAGTGAAESPDHDGFYIWEDAHLVKIPDTPQHSGAEVGALALGRGHRQAPLSNAL